MSATTPKTLAIVRRRGFSLIEMIVVLVLLGSLLAVALPSLFRPLGKAEIRDAAKQVQTALMDARMRAIESGVVHEFRYEPGGSRYEIRALGEPEDIAATDEGNPAAAENPVSPVANLSLEPLVETLPNDIIFHDLKTDATAEPPVAVDTFAAPNGLTAMEEELNGANWSAGVRFYSNGRSRNAHIKLLAPKDWSIDILLRGLTGAALLGDPRHEETDQNTLASPSWHADHVADSP